MILPTALMMLGLSIAAAGGIIDLRINPTNDGGEEYDDSFNGNIRMPPHEWAMLIGIITFIVGVLWIVFFT